MATLLISAWHGKKQKLFFAFILIPRQVEVSQKRQAGKLQRFTQRFVCKLHCQVTLRSLHRKTYQPAITRFLYCSSSILLRTKSFWIVFVSISQRQFKSSYDVRLQNRRSGQMKHRAGPIWLRQGQQLRDPRLIFPIGQELTMGNDENVVNLPILHNVFAVEIFKKWPLCRLFYNL